LLNEELQKKFSCAAHFAGEKFMLDGAGVIYWPRLSMLVVSDIHFEKGSYFARRGQPLPLHDTRDTLERLEKLIESYQPRHVLSLGDNMHDAGALTRMLPADLQRLQTLCGRVARWDWIIGNHDKGDYRKGSLKEMNFSSQITVDGITFTHDILENVEYQVIGHYHPKITVKTRAQSVSGKCFVVAAHKLIMPAFGSYTGGLDVHAEVFQTFLNSAAAKYFLIRNDKIWRVR
jgi:DNA ligase-associated metallophosphoesterase